MSFVNQQQQTNRPGAAIAVVGIHAVLGVGLVFGLGGVITEIIQDDPFDGVLIKADPIDIPPPPPQPTTEDPARVVDSTIYTPPVDPVVPRTGPAIGSIVEPPAYTDVGPVIPTGAPGLGTTIVPLPASNMVDPVGATARNDNSRWVTQDDYKSRWRREEMAGIASFQLGIGADGRVDNCTITASSGHSQLDRATCTLVTRRAQFNPARNSSDEAVAGSYSGSVLWQLPE